MEYLRTLMRLNQKGLEGKNLTPAVVARYGRGDAMLSIHSTYSVFTLILAIIRNLYSTFLFLSKENVR